ncbi:hypothetical protein [Labedella endophytica]|jgi:hypothetical protein|uniref:hypothetical protein n=1 Tax=Labedella endophytica TaxID=1523160 RepID=UPI0014084C06|nr:hypothetical protein [Labedella endophytica]
MMFALALLLFLAGMYLFALAFVVTSFQGLIFTAGILVISLSIFIPVHLLRKN